jgi:hypothetical protein
MPKVQETPPTSLDYEIAAARLQQANRDCDITGSGKVWVQIFTPSDVRPAVGSKVTWAAVNLMGEILPHFKAQKDGVMQAEGCAGFVLTTNDLTRLRAELSKKYSAIEPQVTGASLQQSSSEGKSR